VRQHTAVIAPRTIGPTQDHLRRSKKAQRISGRRVDAHGDWQALNPGRSPAREHAELPIIGINAAGMRQMSATGVVPRMHERRATPGSAPETPRPSLDLNSPLETYQLNQLSIRACADIIGSMSELGTVERS
jgi:hypothetical protein